jgi:hypothetical protein
LRRRQRERLRAAARDALDEYGAEPIIRVAAGYVESNLIARLLPTWWPVRFQWLVATETRICFVDLNALGTKPVGIAWQRPLDQVTAVSYRPALLTQRLELRRKDDGVQIRFRSPRQYRHDVRALARELAE